MTAPDRPTREQGADALALIDDLFATFLIPHDDADPMHAGWTRGASVRADVAQGWRDRRAALVARTPQPARGPVRVGDPDPTPEHADETCEETCHPVGSCSFGAGHDGDHVAGDGQRVVGVAPASAPLPAVPDGPTQ